MLKKRPRQASFSPPSGSRYPLFQAAAERKEADRIISRVGFKRLWRFTHNLGAPIHALQQRLVNRTFGEILGEIFFRVSL